MHTWFSPTPQLFQDSDYPILLEEVASRSTRICSRTISFPTGDDPKMRAYLVDRELDGLRGTVFRQTIFAEFGRDHPRHGGNRRSGDAGRFDRRITGFVEAYFAEFSFSIPSFISNACASRTSIRPFTCINTRPEFPLLSEASRRRVLAGRSENCREAYLKVFRSDGSRFPVREHERRMKILTTPQPIEGTLQIFERRLEELEALLL